MWPGKVLRSGFHLQSSSRFPATDRNCLDDLRGTVGKVAGPSEHSGLELVAAA